MWDQLGLSRVLSACKVTLSAIGLDASKQMMGCLIDRFWYNVEIDECLSL